MRGALVANEEVTPCYSWSETPKQTFTANAARGESILGKFCLQEKKLRT